MARMISQTLTLKSQSLIRNSPTFVASRFINIRHQSKKPQLSESDRRSDKSEPDSDILYRRKLEEEVEAIIARRAAPDWILFVPGSSYWVPPTAKMTTETTEVTYISPVRGWPSFSYFVEGILPHDVDNSPEKACPTTDDEESGLQSADKISGVLPNMVENSPEKASPKTDDE